MENNTTVSKVEKSDILDTSDILNPNIEMTHEMFPHFKWKLPHNDAHEIVIMEVPREYILVGSENNHIISIYSLLGKIHCLYNLELPLPIFWNLDVSSYEKKKQRFQRALSILNKVEEFYK